MESNYVVQSLPTLATPESGAGRSPRPGNPAGRAAEGAAAPKPSSSVNIISGGGGRKKRKHHLLGRGEAEASGLGGKLIGGHRCF